MIVVWINDSFKYVFIEGFVTAAKSFFMITFDEDITCNYGHKPLIYKPSLMEEGRHFICLRQLRNASQTGTILSTDFQVKDSWQ